MSAEYDQGFRDASILYESRMKSAEAESLSIRKNMQLLQDALKAELKISRARAANLEHDVALSRTSVENVWLWSGDGSDGVGSLACPVIMESDTLRDILKGTDVLRTLKELADAAEEFASADVDMSSFEDTEARFDAALEAARKVLERAE